jgi:hypothetical protein
MYGSDNTPELRARLRPHAGRETEWAIMDDFNNLLTVHWVACEKGDARLIEFAAGELRRAFADALRGKRAA